MKATERIFLAATLVVLTAVPSQAGAPTPKTTIADPVGDSFGVAADPDINLFSAVTDGSNLILVLGFVNPVTPIDAGMANALGGQIELDTDRNPATGSAGGAATFCPMPPGIGVDATVSLASYDSMTGQLQVSDSMVGVNSADATFNGTTVEVTIPLAFLSGDGTGFVDAVALVGSVTEPTDCAPDGAFITSSLPAPLDVPTLAPWGWTTLVGALLLAGLGVLRRARSSTADAGRR